MSAQSQALTSELVATGVQPNQMPTLAEKEAQFRTYVVTEELMAHKWNQGKTAKALGIHRNTLFRIMQELKIGRNL